MRVSVVESAWCDIGLGGLVCFDVLDVLVQCYWEFLCFFE